MAMKVLTDGTHKVTADPDADGFSLRMHVAATDRADEPGRVWLNFRGPAVTVGSREEVRPAEIYGYVTIGDAVEMIEAIAAQIAKAIKKA